jgi:hypothetical protein
MSVLKIACLASERSSSVFSGWYSIWKLASMKFLFKVLKTRITTSGATR